ncbi:protein DEHYDRATION-INDUCED 19 [Oryza brachyantha]|uniref:protein DEHYDRATION-INDUCED 19 n=1 Tax=Oryza brachyantha TaxID=4533 RepID=UPI0003EA8300|nr:protein DEHYDRATION-INDUCED 19 [Oryza brachyantha]
MDSEHWISRLAAAKRFYAAQLGHADRAGMEEMDMDEEVRPEFACPYCYEDHDVVSLCAHLEEEHPFEPHAAPCPICSDKIAKDMLNHITVQHGYLFKNRRRLRRFVIPGSQALSLLSRDLREAHLQVLLGGGGHRSSSSNTTNISADPLLSSFGLSFATSDVEETSKPPSSIPDDASMVKETPAQHWVSRVDSSLTSEEREQKRKQASVRATFVQDLLLTTLFGD